MSAIVVFQSGYMFSSGVWIGGAEDAPDLIRASIPNLKRGFPFCSVARFCGCCQAWIDGNEGLALIEPPQLEDSKDFQNYRNLHGGLNLYVVCMDTGQVSGFGAKSFTIDNFYKVCPT